MGAESPDDRRNRLWYAITTGKARQPQAESVDRRTRCLMCGGRCNPDRYPCRACNRRLWAEIAADLIDSALAAQETTCTSPKP